MFSINALLPVCFIKLHQLPTFFTQKAPLSRSPLTLLLAVYQGELVAAHHAGDMQVQYEYGAALLETGAAAQAAEVLQRAMEDMGSNGAGGDAAKLVDLQLALCQSYRRLGQTTRALATLQGVPVKLRTAAVHLALADLFGETGATQQAIASLKDVLREHPLALDCLQRLLHYEVPKIELLALISSHKSVVSEIGWLDQWLTGHRAGIKGEHTKAIAAFGELEARTCPRNFHLLSHMAVWHWKQGCLPAAKQAFERAHESNPTQMDKMDVYAHVLQAHGHAASLNKLAMTLMDTDKSRVEPWLAFARYCQLLFDNSADPRAARDHIKLGLHFVEQGCQYAPQQHAEVHMVRGTLLRNLDKNEQAAVCFQQALKISRDVSAAQGLVSCYLSMGRLKEALIVARDVQASLPRSPRANTLVGVVCRRFADGNSKARRAFETALGVDPNCMDAVFALCELEAEEQHFDRATQLLKDHLSHSRTDFVYRQLGDVYMVGWLGFFLGGWLV